MYPKHEEDVYGWAIYTAQLLRDKKMSELDFENIILISANEDTLPAGNIQYAVFLPWTG